MGMCSIEEKTPMIEYPKIETIWIRDEKTRGVIVGQYRTPEFDFLKDCEWVGTEKIDGTNIRIGWDGENVEIGGRTAAASIPAHLVQRLVRLFPAEKFRETYPGVPMTLFGEGFGVKIQKAGGEYLGAEVDFALFDVRVDRWWLERLNIEDVGKTLGINFVVPIVFRGSLSKASDFVQRGFRSIVARSELLAEGIVVRPFKELFDRKGQRIIGKIKTRDFK